MLSEYIDGMLHKDSRWAYRVFHGLPNGLFDFFMLGRNNDENFYMKSTALKLGHFGALVLSEHNTIVTCSSNLFNKVL